MVRKSNNLIGCLNFCTFLLSIPIFAGGIWLVTHQNTDCTKVMNGRAVALGAFLMVVSLAGFIGACFRVTWLMRTYLILMLILILLHVVFIIFDFAVSAKGSGGEAEAGRGFKEYHLGEYSHWFRDAVTDNGQWGETKECMVENNICGDLQESNESFSQFYQSKLQPFESGCCKPPSECGFIYKKPSVWIAPVTGFNSTNPDCKAWSNNNNKLCYDCDSCKAGVIANLKSYWRSAAIINTVFLTVLIAVYAIGCKALKNNEEENAIPNFKVFV